MNKMSLKELIEKIPHDLSVPEDKNSNFFINDQAAIVQIRKARWLYIRLGEFLNYNIQATISKIKINEIYNENVDYDNIEKNRYICKQISEIYAKALNMIGIKAVTVELISDFEDKDIKNHVGTIFEIDGQYQFFCDLTLDLKNIKNGMRTHHFATSFPNLLTDSKIQNNFGHNEFDWIVRSSKCSEYLLDRDIEKYIDIDKIGYKKYNMYTNSYLDLLFKEFTNDDLVKDYIIQNRVLPNNEKEKQDYILKYKFEFLIQNLDLEQQEYLSGREFLEDVIDSVFTDSEKKKIFWFNMSRITGDIKKFATCFKLNSKLNNFYYIYRGNEIPRLYEENEFFKYVKFKNWNVPKEVAEDKSFILEN